MIEYKNKKKIVSSIKEINIFNVPNIGALRINACRYNSRNIHLNSTRYINRINTISFKALEYDHWRIVQGIFPFAISDQEEEYRGGTQIFAKISDYKRKVHKK